MEELLRTIIEQNQRLIELAELNHRVSQKMVETLDGVHAQLIMNDSSSELTAISYNTDQMLDALKNLG